MHNKFPNYFTFINKCNKNYIRNLDKKIAIIYRDYTKPYIEKEVLKIKKICKENGRKLYLSNDLKLAVKLGLDGIYLPSFNKKLNILPNYNRKKFIIMGSAHTMKEIKIKEKQGVEMIFLAPLFKTKKNDNFLNPIKFNYLASKTSKKVIALGGITSKNLNRLKTVKAFGFAGISYFDKNDKIKIKK